MRIIATPRTPGKRMGKVTYRSRCQALAPRSVAASSHERSNRLITANMANRPNGSVQVSCAASAEVNRLGSSPRNLKPKPDSETDEKARA